MTGNFKPSMQANGLPARLVPGFGHLYFDTNAVDMSNLMTHPEARSTAEAPMTLEKPDITDKALALTRRIVALEARELTLQQEIGSKQSDLAAVHMEKEKAKADFATLMGEPKSPTTPRIAKASSYGGRDIPAKIVKKKHSGRKSAKKSLGNNGWIHAVYSYMQRHPGEELSPEVIAQELGSPDKNGLTSTCLRRLLKGEKISFVRRGRFMYGEPKE